jgi:hypothetical protein
LPSRFTLGSPRTFLGQPRDRSQAILMLFRQLARAITETARRARDRCRVVPPVSSELEAALHSRGFLANPTDSVVDVRDDLHTHVATAKKPSVLCHVEDVRLTVRVHSHRHLESQGVARAAGDVELSLLRPHPPGGRLSLSTCVRTVGMGARLSRAAEILTQFLEGRMAPCAGMRDEILSVTTREFSGRSAVGLSDPRDIVELPLLEAAKVWERCIVERVQMVKGVGLEAASNTLVADRTSDARACATKIAGTVRDEPALKRNHGQNPNDLAYLLVT